MAKIYPKALPNQVRKEPGKRAEVKLYDALCQQMHGNWTIFYHVAWLGAHHDTRCPTRWRN